MIYTICLTPAIEKRVRGINVDEIRFDAKQFSYNVAGTGMKVSKYLKHFGIDSTCAYLSGSKASKFIKEELGLSMVINPELMTANKIARALSIPSALEETTFFKGKIQMISIKVKEDSNLVNNSINVITKKFKGRIIICAIKRDGEIIVPTGATKILVGDKLYITGTLKDINGFLKEDNIISSKVRNVLIKKIKVDKEQVSPEKDKTSIFSTGTKSLSLLA